MRPFIVWILCLLAAAGQRSAACAAAADAPQLLPNPSFEGEYWTTPRGWKEWVEDKRSLVFVCPDEKRARTGRRALSIDCIDLPAGKVMVVTARGAGLVFAERQSYEFGVWARADRLMTTVELLALDRRSDPPKVVASELFRVGREWTRLVMRFHSERGPRPGAAAVALAQEGMLWIDDAYLRPWTSSPERIKPLQGNLVPNGSFEFGMEGWFLRGPIRADFGVRARRGARALRLSVGTSELLSAAPPTRPGREHALSMSLMADPPRAARIGVVCGDPERPVVAFEKRVQVGAQWARVWARGGLPAAPGDRYYVRILPGSEPGRLWVDAVQLEEASQPKPFRPASVFHATVSADRADPFYDPGDAVTLTACCANTTWRIAHVRARARLLDAFAAVVDERVLSFDARPGVQRIRVPLSTRGKTGAFCVEFGGAGKLYDLPLARGWFVVRPRGAKLAPSGRGYFGVQLPGDAPDRLWVRAGRAAVLATLPDKRGPAAWARLAARRRGRAAAWELFDSTRAGDAFAGRLRAAYMAVKKADPNAAVVASCSAQQRDPSAWIGRVIDSGGRDFFDAVGYANFSLDEWREFLCAAGIRKALTDRGRPAPVCAVRCAPAYLGAPRSVQTPVERAAGLLRSLIMQRAVRVDRAFLSAALFDARLWTGFTREARRRRVERMYVEPAVGLAVRLLDRLQYVRQLPIKGAYAFVFSAPGKQLIALWAFPTESEPAAVKLLAPAPAVVLDMMGNPIARRAKAGYFRLRLTRSPIYLVIGM